MKHLYNNGIRVAVGCFVLLGASGCLLPKPAPIAAPPPPLRSVEEQVARVDANVAGIVRTLSGGGISVSARIHEGGKEHRYDLDGKIRFLPPRHLYFDLSHLGAPSAVHIGSNEELFWVWVKPEQNRLWWGRWSDLNPEDVSRMPLSPDAILSAMGLSSLPGAESPLRGPQVQVEGDQYYKLLYCAGEQELPWIQREYWLDRYPPFLPRVVIFRQRDGQVQMRASLDDYQTVEDSGVYVAREIQMMWPGENDSLRIRFGRLKFDASITAESPAFALEPRRVPVPKERWEEVTQSEE